MLTVAGEFCKMLTGNFGLKIKVKDMILWKSKSDADEESPFDGFQLTRRKGVKRPRSPVYRDGPPDGPPDNWVGDPTASGDFIPPPVKLARQTAGNVDRQYDELTDAHLEGLIE